MYEFIYFNVYNLKQVGSPTKARARFLKIGLSLNWEAAVGFTKWRTVIFSDLVSKGRLAKPDWQGQTPSEIGTYMKNHSTFDGL